MAGTGCVSLDWKKPGIFLVDIVGFNLRTPNMIASDLDDFFIP